MEYIYKLFIFILILAILRILREIAYLWFCFKTNKRYELSKNRRLWLWSSISYIITLIISGI